MLRSIAVVLFLGALSGLAGCDQTSGPATPLPTGLDAKGTWWMLSPVAPDAKTPATPLGYVQARPVNVPGGGQGTIYLVFDLGFNLIGHVTDGGTAVRYSANPTMTDQPLGRALIADQFASMLGVPGQLYTYDLKGRPKVFP